MVVKIWKLTNKRPLQSQPRYCKSRTSQNSSQRVISVWHAFETCWWSGFSSHLLLSDKSSSSGFMSNVSISAGNAVEPSVGNANISRHLSASVLFISVILIPSVSFSSIAYNAMHSIIQQRISYLFNLLLLILRSFSVAAACIFLA